MGNPEFICNGTDSPPSDAAENSIFECSNGELLRMTEGQWVKLEVANDENGDK